MGAGLLVRVAVWLMSRKVYAASAEAGASYCWFFTEPNGDQLREIAGLVDAGTIKPVIDREFAFDRVAGGAGLSRKGPRARQGRAEGEIGTRFLHRQNKIAGLNGSLTP